jgi:hypothetical protein
MSKIGSKTHKQIVEDVRGYLDTRMRIAVRFSDTKLGSYKDVVETGLFADGLNAVIPGLDYDSLVAEQKARESIRQGKELLGEVT